MKPGTSKEQADLAATQAPIPAARTDRDCKRKLVRDRVVSQSDLDQSQSRFEELTTQSISLEAMTIIIFLLVLAAQFES